MIEGDTRRMQLISRSVFHAGLIGFDRAASSRKVSNGTRRHNSLMFVMGCHGVRYNLAETAIVGDPPKPSKYRRPFRSLPTTPVRFVTRSLLSSFPPFLSLRCTGSLAGPLPPSLTADSAFLFTGNRSAKIKLATWSRSVI